MSTVLLRVCRRCSAAGRVPIQAVYPTWNLVTTWKRSMFYKKQYSWDRAKVFEFLYDDHSWFSLKGLDRHLKKRDEKAVIESQRLKPEVFVKIGPDRWVANFVLAYNGKIKLRGDVVWLNKRMSLQDMRTMEVEGIDASTMILYPLGLENLKYLDHLRYIKFGSYISDWYLFHLHNFEDSLEIVDVSGCTRITDAGIASLSCLKKMKGLDITGCTNVKNPEALALHLETLRPELVILGLESFPKQEETLLQKELKTSRFLNLGEDVVLKTEKQLSEEDKYESLYSQDEENVETKSDVTPSTVV